MRDTLPHVLQAATATILLSLLIENTATWLMNNPIVIPTETCIILSPSENEPKYADSAVVFEEYAERRPPSRPNADYKPGFHVGREGSTWITGKNAAVRDKPWRGSRWSPSQSGGYREEKTFGAETQREKSLRTGTKNIKPGTALVYDPPLENLP